MTFKPLSGHASQERTLHGAPFLHALVAQGWGILRWAGETRRIKGGCSLRPPQSEKVLRAEWQGMPCRFRQGLPAMPRLAGDDVATGILLRNKSFVTLQIWI
jgi:hypothetical protein